MSENPERKFNNINAFISSLTNYVLGYKDFFFQMESVNKEIVRGVLLYTDEDKTLKKYIQENFQYFHKLSGNWCQIFILEKPDNKWITTNLSLIEKIKFKFAPAIDKSEAYDIARELKIDINQIPCLVFFGADVKQRLIIPINKEEYLNNLSKYFRELFAVLEKMLNQAEKSSDVSAFETISYHFEDIINYLDKNAQKTGSQNHYLYHNQTIITQNFQNERDIILTEISQQINNDLKDAQIGGSLVNADTVNAEQIGGNINNNPQNQNHQETDNSTVKTILILASNPKNTSQLRLGEEVREIDAGLQRAKKRELFDLKQCWAVRSQEVYQALLDFKPQFVHFIGHGSGDDGLLLEDENGNLKLVDTEAIAELFGLFSNKIECVVLNACYSEVQAIAIAKYIPYVIGMNQAIGDKAAIKFATGFYNALGAGESVEFAYKLGCNVIQLDGIPEHLTPVLKNKQTS